MITGILNQFVNHYGNIEFENQGSERAFELLKNEANEEMLNSPEMWVAEFTKDNQTFAIMADGELTSSGEYLIEEL